VCYAVRLIKQLRCQCNASSRYYQLNVTLQEHYDAMYALQRHICHDTAAYNSQLQLSVAFAFNFNLVIVTLMQ
jgi:hypothetical protein